MDPSSNRDTCKRMEFFTVKTQWAESWQRYNVGWFQCPNSPSMGFTTGFRMHLHLLIQTTTFVSKESSSSLLKESADGNSLLHISLPIIFTFKHTWNIVNVSLQQMLPVRLSWPACSGNQRLHKHALISSVYKMSRSDQICKWTQE